jgi:methylase of polypeptide subunit release factors
VSQASDQLLDSLASLPRLLGAAVALGAERVPGLSPAEQSLGREVQAVPPPAPELRRLTSLIRDGQDPLGDAFCIMRTAADRRVDGATYTPPAIIAAMVGWASNGPIPVRTIDPGAGSGRFTVAAGLAFPEAQLVAVELDPLAAMLCRANIAVHGMESRAQVMVEDYRDFIPGPPIDGPSLYIGNPPYVRHHQIAPEWKRWLTATARGRGLDASQLAGLHVYFFLATAQHASPGDRGVFITASEWLDVNYGALVRDLALDGLGGQAIHLIEPTAKPFEDADTTGAIMCFEVGSQPPTIRLRRAKSAADLGNLTGGQPIRRERLTEARRWTPLTRATRKIPDGHIELGELCRVHRGAVTGANRVFVIDAESNELPPEVMFATVTRARELFTAGAVLHATASLRQVVDIPPDLDHFEPDARKLVDRFLRRAKRLGVHEGYVARHRPAWWSVGLRTPAPILATYMARKAPAIVRNMADARHINIAHGLYPREPMGNNALDRLAKALQDSITVGEGRTYAGGLTKFEPREMERLMVPDVTATPA